MVQNVGWIAFHHRFSMDVGVKRSTSTWNFEFLSPVKGLRSGRRSMTLDPKLLIPTKLVNPHFMTMTGHCMTDQQYC